MNRIVRLSAIALMIPLAAGAVAAEPAGGFPDTTVYVDCAKGQSISQALKRPAGTLVIEISGLCEEDVALTRSDVTLRGTDPALDGIRGIVMPERGRPSILLENVARVRLENMTIYGDPGFGLYASHVNSLELSNVIIVGGGAFGALLRSTQATMENVTLRESRVGLRADMGSFVNCTRCRAELTAAWGFAGFHSTLQLSDTFTSGTGSAVRAVGGAATLSGGEYEGAIVAIRGAHIDLLGISMMHPGAPLPFSLEAHDQSTVRARDSSLLGPALVLLGSHLRLETNTTLDGAFGLSIVGDSGNVEIQADCSSAGSWVVEEFARMVVHESSTHSGDVQCHMGGDVWCASPASIPGGCVGCANCPSP